MFMILDLPKCHSPLRTDSSDAALIFHAVKGFPHSLILAPEKNLAQSMAIRRQNPACMDSDGEQARTAQPAGRLLMVRTTEKAANPSLRSS